MVTCGEERVSGTIPIPRERGSSTQIFETFNMRLHCVTYSNQILHDKLEDRKIFIGLTTHRAMARIYCDTSADARSALANLLVFIAAIVALLCGLMESKIDEKWNISCKCCWIDGK